MRSASSTAVSVEQNELVEFADTVRSRRMVRAFDPARPIPRELLEILLKQAIRAPSAGHTQGRLFVILDDITTRDFFWSATSEGPPDAWRRGMQSAPAIVLCYADREAYLERYAEPDKGWSDRDPSRWPIPFWHVDVGMAVMTLLLAARDRGLGACFFGVPQSSWAALAERFDVAPTLLPVGAVALGTPAEGERSRPLRRRRRPFDEVVRFAAPLDQSG